MTGELPRFQKRHPDHAQGFAEDIFTRGEDIFLLELVSFEDQHYRAIFSRRYFQIPAGQQSPSKSQWSTLKKKLKRHDPLVFVFKEHGELEHQGQPACYLDFGFLSGIMPHRRGG